MKLQDASRKEISRIAGGVLACDLIMIATLFLLSLVGVGTFSLGRILLGTLGGSLIAIGNFTLLCLTVQRAADTKDQKLMRQRFQLSYNLRLLLQAGWVVASFLIPQVHFIAGAAPTVFPNVVIYYLQARGKLMPKQEGHSSSPVLDDEPEDRLESFEV